MNIMIVSSEPLAGVPNMVATLGYNIFFRSHITGLKSLAVDYAICLPGCSQEQIALAEERTRSGGGKLQVLAAPVGYEEGDVCGRDGCAGVIKEAPVEDCSCHISPPCSRCVEDRTYCPECGWEGKYE